MRKIIHNHIASMGIINIRKKLKLVMQHTVFKLLQLPRYYFNYKIRYGEAMHVIC